MKVKNFILFSLLLTFGSSFAQEILINFKYGTWAEIKAEAKKQEKPIFVDAYTSWCGPCKWMAKNVFTNKEVAAYYNANFITAKIDMERGEGKEFAKNYEVRAYPNLLFIDADGNVLHRVAGARNGKSFIELAKKAVDAKANFAYYQNQYKTGNRDAKLVNNYIDLLGDAALPTNTVVNEFLASKKESEYIKEENWMIINSYLSDVDALPFKYLMRHKADFASKYGEEKVDSKIYKSYISTIKRVVYSKKFEIEKLDALKLQLQKSGYSKSDKLVFMADLICCEHKQDWEKYSTTAANGATKYLNDDSNTLNSIAWNFYENIDDKTLLKEAELWAKTSVELNEHPANIDTYAAVLFKLGKKEEAIKMETKAISLAKEKGDDTSSYEEMLAKIKAM